MGKLLIVDDDEAMLGLYRARLSDGWEIIQTNEPEQALALALEHKPDAILLDLMMPKFSGLQLCQNFHSLSYTSLIPIFVISGQGAARHKEQCENLGAKGYFQKPVDFAALKSALGREIQGKQAERRADVRIRMHVAIKLRGRDIYDKEFEESTATENVSAKGFFCPCNSPLWEGAVVEVFLEHETERFVGRAQVVRSEPANTCGRSYGFRFNEVTSEWVLQPNR